MSLAQEDANMIKSASLEYLVDVFICHVYVYIYIYIYIYDCMSV